MTLGLGGPIAMRMLAAAGVASSQTPEPAFVPTRRGGGGALKVLMWQAPTILHPRLAVGWKDFAASRIFYEPLASFGPDGALVPILAREISSIENGGVSRDGRSVIWKLKPGVAWHDGKPFTAGDVVFTWEYVTDPTTGSPGLGFAQELEQVARLDDHTVKLVFKRPTGYCLAARIEGRSSVARCGVLVHFTAPTVHADYKGTLTLAWKIRER